MHLTVKLDRIIVAWARDPPQKNNLDAEQLSHEIFQANPVESLLNKLSNSIEKYKKTINT